MRSRSLILRGAAGLGLLLAGSFAALPADKTKPQATVQEETRAVLVEVPVTVLDRAGKPVENLQLQDFEIFDDGKPQTITGFEVLDQRTGFDDSHVAASSARRIMSVAARPHSAAR